MHVVDISWFLSENVVKFARLGLLGFRAISPPPHTHTLMTWVNSCTNIPCQQIGTSAEEFFQEALAESCMTKHVNIVFNRI